MFSIILPVYNAEKTIEETLQSIKNQDYTDYELVIINDGSNDNTLELIKKFIINHESIDVKLISRSNKGFMFSLEEGIQLSKNRLIARIDSDDVWESNHLSTMMKCFRSNHGLVLAGSNAKLIDISGKVIGSLKMPQNIEKAMLLDNPLIHSSVVFDKNAYYKTNGYLRERSDVNDIFADYRLWLEFLSIGKCVNSGIQTLRYRFLESSMSRMISKLPYYRGRLELAYAAYSKIRKYHFYFLFCITKIVARIMQHRLYEIINPR